MGCLLLAGGPSSAQPQDADGLLHQAELTERGLGDLARAAELYEQAARAAGEDNAARALAECRAASCLRRLGETERARLLLLPWAAETSPATPELQRFAAAELDALGDAPETPTAPVVPAESADADARVSQMERELERQRARADELLANEERNLEEIANLVAALRRAEQALEEARSRDESVVDAAEALRRRQAELRERSRRWLNVARVLYEENRFADARAWLAEALTANPDNADARALLTRVSAPAGDRERLYQKVLETLALAREVRNSRLRREVESLLDDARRRQAQGDMLGSAAPLSLALGILESGAMSGHAAETLRDDAVRLLAVAEQAGARRTEVAAEPALEPEGRWFVALKGLLSFAGAEVAKGLELRFHDLDQVLEGAARGLPPVGARPLGFQLSGERVSGARLLAAFLESSESQAFQAPGSSLEAVGSSVVAVAPLDVHQRLDERLTGMALSPGPSAALMISLHRAPAGDWGALMSRLGLLPGGPETESTRVVPAAKMAALEDELARTDREELGRAELVAAPLRAFRLTLMRPRSRVVVDVLPVGGEKAGAAASVDAAWLPSRPRPGPEFVHSVRSGAALQDGSALVLFGIPDPEEPGRDLLLMVRRGRSAPPRLPAPAGSSRRPPAPPQDPTGGMDVAEFPLPRWLVGLHEVGPSPLHLPEHPIADRAEGLRTRLEERAPGATLLEVHGDRVLVVGPPAAHDAARALIAQLAAPGLQSVHVVAHQVSLADEGRLFRAEKSFNASPRAAIAWTVISDERSQRIVEGLLSQAGGRVPLRYPNAMGPTTDRLDVAQVVRSIYRKALETERREDLTWSRSETDFVDEGLLLAIRPFGRTPDGRLDFDLSLRAAFLRDRAELERVTELGTVRVTEPVYTMVAEDLRIRARPGDLVVLARMVSPFPSEGDRDRLVVLVRPGP